jgi:hypothetical protein
MPRYRPATYISNALQAKDILFHHPINDITKMSKFKVGDRVRAVTLDPWARSEGLRNCNYVVIDTSPEMIRVDGINAWFDQVRFELIGAARKFKPGDKVRCVKPEGSNSQLSKDVIYEVLRCSPHKYPGDPTPRIFLKETGAADEWYEERFVLAEQCNTQTNIKSIASHMGAVTTDKVFSIPESKILEAASCATEDAKALLNKLFPEAFDKRVNVSGSGNIKIDGIVSIEPRQSLTADPEHHLKSFYLNPTYEWKLERDKYNVLVLVPTKK